MDFRLPRARTGRRCRWWLGSGGRRSVVGRSNDGSIRSVKNPLPKPIPGYRSRVANQPDAGHAAFRWPYAGRVERPRCAVTIIRRAWLASPIQAGASDGCAVGPNCRCWWRPGWGGREPVPSHNRAAARSIRWTEQQRKAGTRHRPWPTVGNQAGAPNRRAIRPGRRCWRRRPGSGDRRSRPSPGRTAARKAGRARCRRRVPRPVRAGRSRRLSGRAG